MDKNLHFKIKKVNSIKRVLDGVDRKIITLQQERKKAFRRFKKLQKEVDSLMNKGDKNDLLGS